MTIRMISRDPNVGFSILLRMTSLKIGRLLDDCCRNRGMTGYKSYSDSYKQSYSDLFRVSIDPRVKPEGDRKESVSEGDGSESVPRWTEKRVFLRMTVCI